jgi:hypothetical protein
MPTATGPINLNVTTLDFETIKNNLKDYLKAQDEFQDYDFEGSGLSILLDVLAYNTHYNGFYANMLNNEAFLDSAVKRHSVVSHAKHIGYTPRSRRAPRAVVTVDITPGTFPSEIVIDKGTRFTTEIDGTTYSFVTTKTYIADPIGGGVYRAEDVEIYEGRYVRFNEIVDIQNLDQRYLITNTNADTTTLTVAVQESPNDTATAYFDLIEDINLIDGESEVFFLQEVEDQQYEIYFGDGILGKEVCDGNVVIWEYLVTNGPVANKAAIFQPGQDIGGTGNINITTQEEAIGGEFKEEVESIRQNAPRFYQAQNRSVTAEDYKTLLVKNASIFTQADSIAVWGGEDNVPPIYGKVFISVKPRLGSTISTALKEEITDEIIKNSNVITITPEIIDPEFLYLEINTDFVYDAKRTSLSAEALSDLVRTTIIDYNENELEFFERTFRYSTFVCLIDDTERSIQNNLSDIKIKKKFTPRLGINTQYVIRYENPLEPETLVSSGFKVNEPTAQETDKYFFRDDGEGNLVLYKQRADLSNLVINAEYGTIDYDEGIVTITCFAPTSLIDSTQVSLTFEPRENDIFTVRNLILTIDEDDITVNGSPRQLIT